MLNKCQTKAKQNVKQYTKQMPNKCQTKYQTNAKQYKQTNAAKQKPNKYQTECQAIYQKMTNNIANKC